MSLSRIQIDTLVASLVLLAALAPLAYAFDLGDHDRARHALAAGEILPLEAVIEKVSRDTPGQAKEVELEHKNDRWVYEIKLLRPGGSLVKLLVDARDGTIIVRRGRDGPANR